MRDYWFYEKRLKIYGPVHKHIIQGMLDKGKLNPESLIWTESMDHWKPTKEVSEFQLAEVRQPPELPHDLMLQTIEQVSQVRPWVRYWARCLDYILWAFVLGTVAIFFPFLLEKSTPAILNGMIIAFIWVFLEPLFLSNWSTTPGKWLLRTRVINPAGKLLSYPQALNRSFSVLFRGLGLGIPLVTLITLIVAHDNLKKNGITTWDNRGGFIVVHRKIGSLRVVVAVIVLIGIFVFLMFNSLAKTAKW